MATLVSCTEFCIDGCHGFVIDELRWEREKNSDNICRLYGQSQELEIYLYDGEETVTKYKKMD